jgi:hypothetical protein
MLIHDERSLLALQGPEAAATLQGLVKEDLSKMYFSNFGRWGAAGCQHPFGAAGCSAVCAGWQQHVLQQFWQVGCRAASRLRPVVAHAQAGNSAAACGAAPGSAVLACHGLAQQLLPGHCNQLHEMPSSFCGPGTSTRSTAASALLPHPGTACHTCLAPPLPRAWSQARNPTLCPHIPPPACRFDVAGVPCWITRTGYTGEDGFELSIPFDSTLKVAEAMLATPSVRLCGGWPLLQECWVQCWVQATGRELDRPVAVLLLRSGLLDCLPPQIGTAAALQELRAACMAGAYIVRHAMLTPALPCPPQVLVRATPCASRPGCACTAMT